MEVLSAIAYFDACTRAQPKIWGTSNINLWTPRYIYATRSAIFLPGAESVSNWTHRTYCNTEEKDMPAMGGRVSGRVSE